MEINISFFCHAPPPLTPPFLELTLNKLMLSIFVVNRKSFIFNNFASATKNKDYVLPVNCMLLTGRRSLERRKNSKGQHRYVASHAILSGFSINSTDIIYANSMALTINLLKNDRLHQRELFLNVLVSQ